MKKKITISVAIAIAIMCGIACYFMFGSTDIANVVPANSVAVAKIDLKKVGEKGSTIAKLLNIDNAEECGLDFQSPAFLFESGEGIFGLVIGVKDDDNTEEWINKLVKNGSCTPIVEKKGVKFTSFNNILLAGFNSNAIVVIGPIVVAGEAEYQLKIAKYLKADEDKSIKTSKLYDKLSTMDDGMIQLVAQTAALPEKLVAPFTLGTPANCSPSDIYITASLDIVNGKYLSIEGETYAIDEETNKSLKDASKAYKKVDGKYLSTISANDAFAISCNIAGKEYIKLLRNNPMFRNILMGLNTTIDINKMLEEVDGDILIKGDIDNKGNISPTLLADAISNEWTEDVDYWKKSCPSGTTITNGSAPCTYSFASSDYHINFGLTNNGKTLFFVPSSNNSTDIVTPATDALPKEITKKIQSNKLCAIVNIKSALSAYGGAMATKLAEPILGDITTVVISVK